MKRFSQLVLLILISSTMLPIANAQDHRCTNTVQWHEKKIAEDPTYAKHVKKHREFVDNFVYGQMSPSCTAGPVQIPVAIHFDSGGNMPTSAAEQACAITLAEDMINQVNEHMAGLEAEATTFNSTFGSCFNTTVGNACMEFCLATNNHPTGFGLTEGQPAVTFGTANMNYPTQFGFPSGTPTNGAFAGYVNIYVVDLGSSGVLGISNGIPGNFNGDGVMINACQFGTSSVSCTGFDHTSSCGAGFLTTDGRTVTHEIGHYFGLFHIWGDEFGCVFNPNSTTECSGSDQISDTPNMSCSYGQYNACGTHNSCIQLPSTCGSPDMYMNFMAYSADQCMYMFTSEQADVMYAIAVSEGYTAAPLPTCNTGPVCYTDLTNSNGLATNETGVADYESSTYIETTQTTVIQFGASVDYDATSYIDLNPDFTVTLGAVFAAFIDGCDSGNGGVNLVEEEGEDETQSEEHQKNQ